MLSAKKYLILVGIPNDLIGVHRGFRLNSDNFFVPADDDNIRIAIAVNVCNDGHVDDTAVDVDLLEQMTILSINHSQISIAIAKDDVIDTVIVQVA